MAISSQFFSKNGETLPIEEAKVSLFSVEYAYGFGVYETIRAIKGSCLFLKEHIERLINSADIIGLEHIFTPDMIEESITSLLNKNGDQTYNVKVLLVGGQDASAANLYIFCSQPLFPDRKLYKEGISVISSQYERLYPHAKTLNMLQSYLSFREVKRRDCYDALFVNRDGNVTEGTRTNFFVVKDRIIYSPKAKDILLGVTRGKVLDVAKKLGFEIIEKDISLKDLDQYDGAFLTSTSSKIIPIRRVDSFEYQEIAKPIRELMAAFDNYLESSRN